MTALRETEYSTESPLYLAFELSKATWKLGFGTGPGKGVRRRSVDAGDLGALEVEIGRTLAKFELPPDTAIHSCYEAGCDGFWLHRYLLERGIDNLVVDSASIEVNRRSRRAKTDRLDVQKLLRMLMRYHQGEHDVWHPVHVPSVAAEDQRHLHRQLITFRRDRNRHGSRIWGLLRTQGLTLKLDKDFLERLTAARQYNGAPLPPGLSQRIRNEYAQLQHIEQAIAELEAERQRLIHLEGNRISQKVRQLKLLKAIGDNISWVLVKEVFGWRTFNNRRELGGLAGLTPTPYQSGDSHREQGIGKAGNTWVRTTMIELAWQWIRHQPDSELTQWYNERFAHGGRAARKRGIVALARKLLIALWHYLERGEVPKGAQLKPIA